MGEIFSFSKAKLRKNGLKKLALKYEFSIFRVHTFFCKEIEVRQIFNQQLSLAKKKKQTKSTWHFSSY